MEEAKSECGFVANEFKQKIHYNKKIKSCLKSEPAKQFFFLNKKRKNNCCCKLGLLSNLKGHSGSDLVLGVQQVNLLSLPDNKDMVDRLPMS